MSWFHILLLLLLKCSYSFKQSTMRHSSSTPSPITPLPLLQSYSKCIIYCNERLSTSTYSLPSIQYDSLPALDAAEVRGMRKFFENLYLSCFRFTLATHRTLLCQYFLLTRKLLLVFPFLPVVPYAFNRNPILHFDNGMELPRRGR